MSDDETYVHLRSRTVKFKQKSKESNDTTVDEVLSNSDDNSDTSSITQFSCSDSTISDDDLNNCMLNNSIDLSSITTVTLNSENGNITKDDSFVSHNSTDEHVLLSMHNVSLKNDDSKGETVIKSSTPNAAYPQANPHIPVCDETLDRASSVTETVLKEDITNSYFSDYPYVRVVKRHISRITDPTSSAVVDSPEIVRSASVDSEPKIDYSHIRTLDSQVRSKDNEHNMALRIQTGDEINWMRPDPFYGRDEDSCDARNWIERFQTWVELRPHEVRADTLLRLFRLALERSRIYLGNVSYERFFR